VYTEWPRGKTERVLARVVPYRVQSVADLPLARSAWSAARTGDDHRANARALEHDRVVVVATHALDPA
jgi:hypothetical protein